MRLGNERRVLLLLFFRFGFAALLVLCRTHEPFEVPDVVCVLPPVAQFMLFAPLRCQRDDFAQRAIPHVDSRGVMHVRFNDNGVAPPMQRFYFLFFYQKMTSAYYHLID